MSKILKIVIGVTTVILFLTYTYMNQYQVSKNNNSNHLDENNIKQGEIIYNGSIAMPIENFIKVTSKFGYRNPVYNSQGIQISGGKLHTGLDLCGSLGSNILSIQDGEITYAGWQNGYGNCVEIKHIDKQGKLFYSFYAHMREESICIKKGHNIVTGQIIGIQGSTGNSNGDHLHFEIRTNSGSNKYAIDPAPYLFTEMEV